MSTIPTELIAGPSVLSLLAVLGLVFSDVVGLRPGRYVCKPLASAAFLWLALALGATDTAYGQWLLAGLLLCMLGDLFLMADDERAFLAGLGAFLCGHLLYIMAFLHLPSDVTGLAWSALPALLLATVVTRWLHPHVDARMRAPVAVYVVAICGMLLAAGLTLGQPAAGLIIGGAWGFAASDISVARRQFVNPAKLNRVWGEPLYFFSQMALAASVAMA